MELLDSLKDKLSDETDALTVEIRMHENRLSLLHRMPTEIMSLMFAFTLPPHQPDVQPAPWTASPVCMRWRAIVVSQPSFWTSICYARPSDQHSSSTSSDDSDIILEPLRRKFETQLRRSGHLPLNVEFNVNRWDDLTRKYWSYLRAPLGNGVVAGSRRTVEPAFSFDSRPTGPFAGIDD
ncbi:hypothetical protein K438DRAFT_1953844 [Mycena galopus ATCC 62051]|nr:hypothetical protein K438DRAFT_1953844 [Mycena galopus ATCC 62051]